MIVPDGPRYVVGEELFLRRLTLKPTWSHVHSNNTQDDIKHVLESTEEKVQKYKYCLCSLCFSLYFNEMFLNTIIGLVRTRAYRT